jgi:hypothetical protein
MKAMSVKKLERGLILARESLSESEAEGSTRKDEIDAAFAELAKVKKMRRHVRDMFLDGQLDKYPSSDASDEYHLWRLVKKPLE